MSRKRISDEQIDLIIKLLKTSDLTIKQISEKAGCSTATVFRYARLRPVEKNHSTKTWLKQNWHFTEKVKKTGISKDGYRIVHKGERGNLRTPTRPDRRFQ